MIKYLKKYWVILVLAVIIIGGANYLLSVNTSGQNRIANTNVFSTKNRVTSSNTPAPTVSPTPTQAPTPTGQQSINSPTVPSGPPQGQISCNYQIPVGPNTFGTADIRANWSNLIVGNNGLVRATVCVTASTQAPVLMTLSNLSSGSWEYKVSWISPNVNYTFALYDDHGGDLANCAGAVLSSCQVHAMLSPTIAPGKTAGH